MRIRIKNDGGLGCDTTVWAGELELTDVLPITRIAIDPIAVDGFTTAKLEMDFETMLLELEYVVADFESKLIPLQTMDTVIEEFQKLRQRMAARHKVIETS